MIDPTVRRIEKLLGNPFVVFPIGALLAAVGAAVLWWAFPLYRDLLSDPFWFTAIFLVLVIVGLLSGTSVCILAERKLAAFTQDRRGPNRVGFWGLLQPVADGAKFFFKEDITPKNVDRLLFMLAPCVTLALAMVGFAIVPWAGDVHWPWMEGDQTVSTQVASLDIGILYILAVGSISVYGIVLAGYASNNKYSFFGGIRAAAQMISYELPIGLALVCVLLVTGSLRLEEIVAQQATSGIWYVFVHPLPFMLILIATFAETNRTPFDLAEAEQELVGGFHTEYSSMKFAMFFLGEYVHIITGSAIMVALFFGGWAPLPFTSLLSENNAWWAMFIKLGVYITKIAVFIAFFMIIRWTIPRLRFDQLMRLAWLSMVPVGIGMVAITGVLAAFIDLREKWYVALAVNVAMLAIMLWYAARSKQPITGRQGNLPHVEVVRSA